MIQTGSAAYSRELRRIPSCGSGLRDCTRSVTFTNAACGPCRLEVGARFSRLLGTPRMYMTRSLRKLVVSLRTEDGMCPTLVPYTTSTRGWQAEDAHMPKLKAEGAYEDSTSSPPAVHSSAQTLTRSPIGQAHAKHARCGGSWLQAGHSNSAAMAQPLPRFQPREDAGAALCALFPTRPKSRTYIVTGYLTGARVND